MQNLTRVQPELAFEWRRSVHTGPGPVTGNQGGRIQAANKLNNFDDIKLTPGHRKSLFYLLLYVLCDNLIKL